MEFQFHKGTIRTAMLATENISQLNFNSIKVRLEHGETSGISSVARFQFHKGTIRTQAKKILKASFTYISIP